MRTLRAYLRRTRMQEGEKFLMKGKDLPTERNNKNQQPKGAEGVEFLGLRWAGNRSILDVCEDLPTKRNNKNQQPKGARVWNF